MELTKQQFNKLIEKLLKFKTFEVHGIKYDFDKVTIDEDFSDTAFINVNVILPNPEQSYIVNHFEVDIHEIIKRISDYLGKNFSYRLNLNINTVNPNKSLQFYISPDLENKIMEEINSPKNRLVAGKFKRKNSENKFYYKLSYKKPRHAWRVRHGMFDMKDNQLNFFVYLDIYDFEKLISEPRVDFPPTLKKVKVYPDMKYIGFLGRELLEYEIENDLLTEIEGLVFQILAGPLNLINYETFIVADLKLDKIDGMRVGDFSGSSDKDIYDIFRK